MLDFLNPTYLLISVPALLAAISVHEFAHAQAADRLGDPTPRVQGRLTLNPLAHLDPLGTLMFILFRFGWGKPVQFDPYNLENPRRDAAIISFAGPAANLLLATALSLFYRFGLPTVAFSEAMFFILRELVQIAIQFNVVLAVFNLLPVHPLDGGKILVGLLPREIAYDWDRILNQYGFIILLVLILPVFGGAPLVWNFLGPTITFLLNLLLPSAGWI